jgi:hypothetical protein
MTVVDARGVLTRGRRDRAVGARVDRPRNREVRSRASNLARGSSTNLDRAIARSAKSALRVARGDDATTRRRAGGRAGRAARAR